MFSLNSLSHKVFEHKTHDWDPREGNTITLNYKKVPTDGKVIKRIEKQIKVETTDGNLIWAQITDVTNITNATPNASTNTDVVEISAADKEEAAAAAKLAEEEAAIQKAEEEAAAKKAKEEAAKQAEKDALVKKAEEEIAVKKGEEEAAAKKAEEEAAEKQAAAKKAENDAVAAAKEEAARIARNKSRNEKKRRAAKRKKEVIKMLKQLTTGDDEVEDTQSQTNEDEESQKGRKAKTERRRRKRKQLREMRKIYATNTGNQSGAIDETILMKAIEDELDAQDAAQAAQDKLDGKGETTSDIPESDDAVLDGDDEDMNEEHMMELLRGSISALAGPEDVEEDDNTEDGEAEDTEYEPEMPTELVRAFRRASLSVPNFVPRDSESEEENA